MLQVHYRVCIQYVYALVIVQAVNQTEELHNLYILRKYQKIYSTPSKSENVSNSLLCMHVYYDNKSTD